MYDDEQIKKLYNNAGEYLTDQFAEFSGIFTNEEIGFFMLEFIAQFYGVVEIDPVNKKQYLDIFSEGFDKGIEMKESLKDDE